MDKNEVEDTQNEILNLFMKWRSASKNEKVPLALTLKEKIGETIPESYGIKIEECNIRYFMLFNDSDFLNCKTQPFSCVYDFCQYLNNFHQKENDWYDTLLSHCIPGSDRQQWIAYNLYRFKFTWKQVCYRLMQKYDLPSRRSDVEKALKETKLDPSQPSSSVEKFNKLFNAYIDELFYDEQTAIQVYRAAIPGEYANMLSTTIIIDEGTCFIYTLADIQQRTAEIINASEKDFICYTSISHTIYSTESEGNIFCQDQHSISNCPDTFVLRWPKNDPRNKRNEAGKNSEPISFLPKTSKAKAKQTPSAIPSVIPPPAVPYVAVPSLPHPPSSSAPVVKPLAKLPATNTTSTTTTTTITNTTATATTPIKPTIITTTPAVVSLPSQPLTSPSNTSSVSHTKSSSLSFPSSYSSGSYTNVPLKRRPSPQPISYRNSHGDRFPPQVRASRKPLKCQNCGANYQYGHNKVCPRKGGRTISRTR